MAKSFLNLIRAFRLFIIGMLSFISTMRQNFRIGAGGQWLVILDRVSGNQNFGLRGRYLMWLNCMCGACGGSFDANQVRARHQQQLDNSLIVIHRASVVPFKMNSEQDPFLQVQA